MATKNPFTIRDKSFNHIQNSVDKEEKGVFYEIDSEEQRVSDLFNKERIKNRKKSDAAFTIIREEALQKLDKMLKNSPMNSTESGRKMLQDLEKRERARIEKIKPII